MGTVIYALGIAAFGIGHLLYAISGTGIGPPFVPGNAVTAGIAAAVLLISAVALVKDRRVGVLFGWLCFLYALGIHGIRLPANLSNPNVWTPFAELVGFGAIAWVLSGRTLVLAGRILFALVCVVFAVLHFRYAEFIANLIPTWMPARFFFANFVGVGFAAAAGSIATGIFGRAGALCLGAMFSIWVVILHFPRCMAKPHDPNEWTSLFVAFTMAGGAFVVARSLRSMRGIAEAT